MIEGRYCRFDESRRPDRAVFAERAVAYTDRKVPALFELLDLAIPADRLLIHFAPIGGGMFITPNRLQLGDNHNDNDLGCVIHECVHWSQQPNQAVYNSRQRVFEGVADYYRIVLSDDRQGDFWNNGKRHLVANFNANDLYDSGSEFVAYLRRLSGDRQFVRALNNALRTNRVQQIDQFFQDRFGRSFDQLQANYPNERVRVVGDRPHEISRYAFFTDMA